jgi:hypothetical protein
VDYSHLEADYRRWREVTMTPPPDFDKGWTPERVAERSGLSIDRVKAVERFMEESQPPEYRRRVERYERLEREGKGPRVRKGTPAPPRPEGNDSFPV